MQPRFHAESAGSSPAARVNPYAIDPAAVVGDDAAKQAAFVDALTLISRRIDLLLALPVEKLGRLVVEAQVRAIGEVGATAAHAGPEA